MTRPWTTLASVLSSDGMLELRKRGDSDYLITVGGRVLMNSFARASEEQLAHVALSRATKRVLIGGLGMGFTLRAALDVLARDASVLLAELNPVVVEWCRGPLAKATSNAVDDPRVRVEIVDVAHLIQNARTAQYDAIVLDLYEGPNTTSIGDRKRRAHPIWGTSTMGAARNALEPGGVLAIWAEDRDDKFVAHLRQCGFDVETKTITAGSGGRKHVVYLGHTKR
ncbi:MAG: spermidine synthase [Kofleriaceae bacterium]